MLNKPFRFSRIILICLLFAGCFYGARQLSAFLHKNPIYFFKNSSEHLDSFPDTEQDTTLPSKPTIVIDPGHGGRDPGKIGINNVLEKDLNLSISFKLQELLQNNGFKVVLTRDKDCDLAINSKKKYKSADLKERVNIITEANPALTISIHQNSFASNSNSSTPCGSEVFYYSTSEDGKKLAYSIERSLYDNPRLNPCRGITSNDSYYIIKKSPTPTVIIECGFLSNYSEAELLSSDSYQQQLVHAIFLGICYYLGLQDCS